MRDHDIVVELAKRHSTAEVHRALFGEGMTSGQPPKTLAELKQGVRQRTLQRHAGRQVVTQP